MERVTRRMQLDIQLFDTHCEVDNDEVTIE